MTTMTLTKKKPTAPDLSAITALDDVPEVHATALAAQEAQAVFNETEARVASLDARAADADPLVQMQARLELRRLAPELALAEARAVSTRRASEAAREAARRQYLDAHRAEFEDKLTRLSAKWLEAETEARAVFVWLDQLAGVVGHAGLLSHWLAVMPAGLRPGGHAEWSERLPSTIGVTV